MTYADLFIVPSEPTVGNCADRQQADPHLHPSGPRTRGTQHALPHPIAPHRRPYPRPLPCQCWQTHHPVLELVCVERWNREEGLKREGLKKDGKGEGERGAMERRRGSRQQRFSVLLYSFCLFYFIFFFFFFVGLKGEERSNNSMQDSALGGGGSFHSAAHRHSDLTHQRRHLQRLYRQRRQCLFVLWIKTRCMSPLTIIHTFHSSPHAYPYVVMVLTVYNST